MRRILPALVLRRSALELDGVDDGPLNTRDEVLGNAFTDANLSQQIYRSFDEATEALAARATQCWPPPDHTLCGEVALF